MKITSTFMAILMGCAVLALNACDDTNGKDKTKQNQMLLLLGSGKTYALRDVGPAGGLIFYINPNAATDGWKYLEAAPASTEWTNNQWGKYGTAVDGTGTAIGTGKTNTNLILAVLNAAPADTDRAAQLCHALSFNGYSDWFLPSRDELNAMYNNLYEFSVGGFANTKYWSSSEYSENFTWIQFFTGAPQDVNDKSLALYVRAIRAF